MKTKPSSIEEIRQRTRSLIEDHEKSIQQFHEKHFPNLCAREEEMSDDICDRLVRFSKHKQCMSTDLEVEAAAEITRLREEIERLREALKPFAKCIETYPDAKDDYEIGFGGVHDADCKVFIRDFRAAAAAIREGGKEG